MEAPVWDESLSTGVADMDAQHRRLFEIIEELQQAMRIGRGQKVMEEILDQLIEYTDVHFSAEEAYMESVAYPALEVHRKEHAQLLRKVREFRGRLRRERVSGPVMRFLGFWVRNHILLSDALYGDFVRASGQSTDVKAPV